MDYSLRPNQFTDDPNDQLAKVEHSGTTTLEQIIRHMTGEGGAIKESEARSNILEFFKSVNYFLGLGQTISLDFLKIRFSITGVFSSKDDYFDPDRHQLNIKITPGRFLKAALLELPLTKVKGSTTSIVLEQVYDFTTKTRNEVLTAGGMVRVLGENMTLNLTDEEQGVYLVADDRTQTKVQFLQLITYGELLFQVPAGLAPGNYTVEVHARIRGAKDLSKGIMQDLNLVANDTLSEIGR